MVTSSSESEHEMSSSIHTDSESENEFDNSTNDSERESIDGNSTEIEHIPKHEMSDNNIHNLGHHFSTSERRRHEREMVCYNLYG